MPGLIEPYDDLTGAVQQVSSRQPSSPNVRPDICASHADLRIRLCSLSIKCRPMLNLTKFWMAMQQWPRRHGFIAKIWR